MTHNTKSNQMGSAFFVGALIGAAATYFLSPKSGKENVEMVKKGFEDTKKKLQEGEYGTKVREFFSQTQDKGSSLYKRAKDELNTRMNKFNDYMDKRRYEQVVEDVIARVKTRAHATQEHVDDLRTNLLSEWEDRKEQMKPRAKAVRG